ncbi:hypothetical protein [Tenacibaculum piscium]|uniref:Lipoprotein n=1 Tax=Tenacibaculum piscium TaxID=1458515 RepID=A0A2H1YGF6_9FLAO|nr:hypothetical protein [Tenacibaculum piscium]MBE7630362.1 hypothetical protein [Tenacibaculum piscium]MBE7670779.1 hypothetical protein [Tenacibaculum piscium]MBE7686522.1 hypothetical protein [Tenacibaculum piscium]MBE7690386.1 hypothetical protein [Tenacibaculum piscium]MCG8183953.1 hypothetical protein [Tenacibaculum piscium]
MRTMKFYLFITVFSMLLALNSCSLGDDDNNIVERNDDDGDGVVNVIDKCAHTPEGVEVDAVGCPVKED